jgi:hypothetical protein
MRVLISIAVAMSAVSALFAVSCGRSQPARSPGPAAATRLPRTERASGVIQVDGGGIARFDYHYDRDQLQQIVVVGDAVIARTGAGTLARFNRDLALDGEQLVSPRVAVIAAGHGDSIIAGLVDGTLAAVDPHSLEVTRVGAVVGIPVFIGTWQQQWIVVAVVDGSYAVYRLPFASPSLDVVPIVIAADAGPGYAGAWIISGDGTLWFGGDLGEWGGRAGSIDLATGVIAPTIAMPDGVIGLLSRPVGVWAYGGMNHLGDTSAAITSLPDRTVLPSTPAKTGERAQPISRMLDSGVGLIVIAWNQVFDVDRTLAAWTARATVPARYVWGRPDAVGAYPGIVDAALDAHGDLLLATQRDGIFRVHGTTVEAHAVGAALPGPIARVDGAGTTLVVTSNGQPYQRVGGTWSPPEIPSDLHDASVRLVPGDGSATYVSIEADGHLVIGLWATDRVTRLADRGLPSFSTVVATGNDVWAFDGESIHRWQSASAAWTIAGRYNSAAQESNGGLGYDLSATAAGDSWLLHSRDVHTLTELRVDRAGAAGVRPVLAGRVVDDVVAWDDGQVVLAIDGDLMIFDVATNRLEGFPFVQRGTGVTHIARDRQGRLWWASGTGLWLVDHDAARLVAVPALIDRTIVDLAADPAGGVAVALGSGGLVQVTFDPGPATP